MIRISRLADYGMVLMQYLAAHAQARFSAAVLASQTNIPLPTVSKILKLLNEAGLVNSTRGVMGGYQLAKLSQSISIVDVISAIDKQPAMTACASGDNICKLEGVCEMRTNWRLINQKIIGVLSEISLEEMTYPMAK